jgi:hypothetical protein
MSEHETALEGERMAMKSAMELRSGLRAEDFQPGDRVRLLPWAQVQAGGHSGTVVGFGPLGDILVALHERPPVAEPVAVSPDLLEMELYPPKRPGVD